MTVTHEHDYSSVGTITGTSRTEYKCSTCGHRTDAVVLDNNVGSKRYIEQFASFPLNKDLYDRFNDPDNYILRRDYYKYYFFKPRESGNRLIQTFSSTSTKISILDSDKKTILSTSESGGYISNALLNFNFESGKVYYLMVCLSPLRSTGDIKLVVTPTTTTYSNFNSIPRINGENVIQNVVATSQGVSMIRFRPSSTGSYTFSTGGSTNNVMYIAIPSNGIAHVEFDDDSAGNMQATITKNNLSNSTDYLIIVSLYRLYSSTSTTSISINITKNS